MGRKKKFIEKGEGVKFFLVHRSQKDPLYLDESLGEHVLVPADPDTNKGLVDAINGLSLKLSKSASEKEELKRKRLKEQQKYGIYYEDDYDYLQHLREVDNEDASELDKYEITKIGSVLIKNEKDPSEDTIEINSKLRLPTSVFASNQEEEVGYFNQAAPDHDPKIGWDPEILKILDEDPDVDFDDEENQLDDDFFLKANAEDSTQNLSSKNKAINSSDKNEDKEVAFNQYDDSDGDNYEDDHEDDDEDDDEDEDEDEYLSNGDFETKSRFSNYSMTSSVIRRNEGLKQLDQHFEKIFAQYDDDQIGSLDTEEIEGFRIINDSVLESALEEFNKLMEKKIYKQERHDTNRLDTLAEENEYDDKYNEENSDEEAVEKEIKTNYEVIKFKTKKSREDRLDCESIISTYSNIYNRPAIISDKTENKNKIKLSQKTGLPLGVLPEKPKSLKQLENIDHKITRILPEIAKRDPNETKEEKKARKTAIKEHKRERRVEKKINKLAFKNEMSTQVKLLNSNNCVNHIKIF